MKNDKTSNDNLEKPIASDAEAVQLSHEQRQFAMVLGNVLAAKWQQEKNRLAQHKPNDEHSNEVA